MILESVLHPAPPLGDGRRKIETITLPSGDLAKHRQRVRTDAGREVGISLPHGATLRDGDVLYADEALAIVVRQAEEDLLRLHPRTPEEFGLLGYQIGNLHRAAMIDRGGIAVLYDKAIEALAQRHHVPWERVSGKFVPAQNQGHSH
ncbi:MAG TPA: urease accessory protein UreE [Planctomycetota bacterium]|jgi:urease accessory protein|nr:urease accessory protein UreE [Planctomycetota bacterium]